MNTTAHVHVTSYNVSRFLQVMEFGWSYDKCVKQSCVEFLVYSKTDASLVSVMETIFEVLLSLCIGHDMHIMFWES